MTLSLRNSIIKASIILSLTVFTFFIISIFYMKSMSLVSFDEINSILSKIFLSNNNKQASPLLWILSTTVLIFVFSIFSILLLYHYFKKKISPEIFFFMLFILAISLQPVRLFQFQIQLLNLSPYFGVIVTRLFFFFRLFGIFCFFASSLFPIGVKFQKFGTILISILLLSITIAALIPIDPTVLEVTLLYKISDKTSIYIMILSIRFLTLINFTRVTISTKSKNYLLILFSSLLIITGDELILIIQIPFFAFFLILIGTILYSRSIYNYYLWI